MEQSLNGGDPFENLVVDPDDAPESVIDELETTTNYFKFARLRFIGEFDRTSPRKKRLGVVDCYEATEVGRCYVQIDNAGPYSGKHIIDAASSGSSSGELWVYGNVLKFNRFAITSGNVTVRIYSPHITFESDVGGEGTLEKVAVSAMETVQRRGVKFDISTHYNTNDGGETAEISLDTATPYSWEEDATDELSVHLASLDEVLSLKNMSPSPSPPPP